MCQFKIGMTAFMFTNDFIDRGTLFVFRDLTKLKVHFFLFKEFKMNWFKNGSERIQKWFKQEKHDEIENVESEKHEEKSMWDSGGIQK